MKMTKICLWGLLLLAPIFLSAQQRDYRFHLAAGELQATENLEAFISNPGIQPAELLRGYYIRLVQFNMTPTTAEKQALEATGIHLLAYIPNYAFLAAIPGNYDLNQLRSHNVRGVHALSATHKLKQNLVDRPLPEWTTNAPGSVDVEVNYFPVLAESEVRSLLLNEGFEMLDNAYKGTVSLRVPAHRLSDVAALPYVSFVEPINPPAEPENKTGRTLHRSNVIASDHPMGRQYDGTGVVVAMGDDGIIGPHIDYQGRLNLNNVTANNGNHGDHVAGTIFGSGNLDPTRRGMAFGAELHAYQVWDAVNSVAASNPASGVMLTSTSYGNGCNAGYTSFARNVDRDARIVPEVLHVFSAGNSGTSNCGYGAGAGWGNVTGGVKVGKNVLAVANLNDNGSRANSSSRGPASDGRIKPDIGAKGTNVWSTVDENNYANFSGTSMAAPGVTGTTAQLIHAYRTLNNGAEPQSALMKGVLLNTADDLGNPGPDFSYGWGGINARRAVEALENQTYRHDSIAQGETDTFHLNVPSGIAMMKVMVYWHDYEGAVNSAVALVNNLDFTVTDPGSTTWQPWVLDPSPNATALNSPATRGTDNLNNMEQVTLEAPVAGNYVFTVDGTNIPQGPQEYFLVYELQDSAPVITYPNGGEGIIPGSFEKIRWDAWGDYGSWSIDYSTDNGTSWASVVTGLNGNRRYFDYTIPSSLQSGEVLFRVSRNGLSDVSDHTLSIMPRPTGLQVSAACPTSITLSWDSIPTASGYDVFMLGNTYMDSIATTSNASYRVTGTNPNTVYWFAVRSRAADGAVSMRTISIKKDPGIFSCQDPNDVGVVEVVSPGSDLFQSCAGTGSFPVKVIVENYGSNSLSNFPVSYSIDGGAVVTETFTGTLAPYARDTFAFSSPVNIGNGVHTVNTWTELSVDNYAPNDSTNIFSEVVAGTVVSVPWAEDFESFNLCPTSSNCEQTSCNPGAGWHQGTNLLTDEIDWRTYRGSTPSSGTGPSRDHNPGNAVGRYMYTEATNCFEKEATLYSPCIDLSNATAPQLVYWFNMNGNSMGRLHLDIFANGEWKRDITPSISWNWGDNWRQRPVDLTPWVGQVINLRWRATTGLDFASDMALDDITITEAVNVDEALSDSRLEVWPNPNTGKFNFALTQLNSEKVRISIVDLTGRIVIQQEFRKFTEELSGQFDLSDQSTGVYYLKVEAGSETFGQRITLQR
jgi:hypothetical protein